MGTYTLSLPLSAHARQTLRADILIITDAAFAAPGHDFMQRVAEARGHCPVRIVAVVIGGETAQAETFADRVIAVDDLLSDREQWRTPRAGCPSGTAGSHCSERGSSVTARCASPGADTGHMHTASRR